MRYERVLTQDGSSTVRDLELGVTYRSTHGADEESRHVFVEGTRTAHSPRVVLEFGFGTARNFLLTGLAEGILQFHAVEHAPLGPEWIDGDGELVELARRGLGELALHGGFQGAWDGISLTLYPRLSDVPDVQATSVYHDPFDPATNPDAWTEEVFAAIAARTHAEGVLGTYSAASHVRAALARAGWFVGSRPGIGRKREVTAAALQADRCPGKPLRMEKWRG